MEKKTLFRGRHSGKKSDSYAMRFYSIRMKILWFINAFYRYIMTTVGTNYYRNILFLLIIAYKLDPSRRNY